MARLKASGPTSQRRKAPMAFKDATIMMNIAASRGLGIVVSILRMKIVSVVLGPSGIALLTNLNLLVIIMRTTAGLGVKESSVRKIAQAQNEPVKQDGLIQLVLTAHTYQFLPALVVLLVASVPLANLLLDAPDLWWLIASASVAVLAEMLALVFAAAFLGTRRTVEFARITLISGALATLVGSVLMLSFGRVGLLGFLISQPVFTIIIGYMRWHRPLVGRIHLFGADRHLYFEALSGGVKLMLSAILAPLGMLIALSIMTDARGIAVAGQYAAAVAIATQYIGTFIAATGTDFYPKLSAEMKSSKDPALASQSIIHQTRLSLSIFSTPLLLFMLLGESIIQLLLSHEFNAAVPLLRILIIPSLIQLAFTPLAFSIVAGGHHGKFLWRNILSVGALVFVAYLTFDKGPLFVAAFAFFLQQFLNAAISTYLAINLYRINLSKQLWMEIGLLIAAASVIFYTTEVANTSSQSVGWFVLLAVMCWSSVTFYRTRQMVK